MDPLESRKDILNADTELDLGWGPPSRHRFKILVALAVILSGVAIGYRKMRSEQLHLTDRIAVLEQELARLNANLAEQKQMAAENARFRVRWKHGRFFSRVISLVHSGAEARGVAWVDYDGDGDLDALVCSRVNHLYQNQNGHFKDVTSRVGLHGGSRCASWADYDGDGDLDVFYSTGKLWANEAGKFKNDSNSLPRFRLSNTEGVGWLDADQDGLPDILISDGGGGIHLALNQRDGNQRFKDADSEWGLGRKGIGVGNGDFLSIADYNGDGFPDFLYNLTSGVLGRNVGGKRFVHARDAGVSYMSERPWKFGTAFGDFDNDGDLDLFVPQNGEALLFLNNGAGKFLNIIRQAGDLAARARDAQSAVWGDVNSDGLLDLVVGFGRRPARVFLNEGNGKMVDESLLSGVHLYGCATSSTGMVLADFDDDGDLDLLITGERTESGILVNNWPRETGHFSLRVRLPSTEAPGAVVRLYDGENKLSGLRQLGLVQTFSSQGPAEAFFGVRAGPYEVSILRSNGERMTRNLVITDEDYLLKVDFLPAKR